MKPRIRHWILVVIAANLTLRLSIWAFYEPIAHPDTPTYFSFAQHIATGAFFHFDGRRPPGYPLLLAAAGLSPYRVWLAQSIIGIATGLLILALTHSLTRKPALAASAALTHLFNLPQLFFEANLLSETLTTFLVTATVLMLVHTCDTQQTPGLPRRQLSALGVFAAGAALTRPHFVYLPFLATGLILWRFRARAPQALRGAAVVLSISLPLILGWCSLNYVKFRSFTLSTQSGLFLMEHTLAFIELAPDRYALVRDIYLRHRDENLAQGGRHAVAWKGLPDLMRETGLPLPAVSSMLVRFSLEMFLTHPFRYARGVLHAWTDFWAAPIYWEPTRLRSSLLNYVARRIWQLQQPALRLANALFLLLALSSVLPCLRRRLQWDLPLTVLASVVLGAAFTQALAIWVENARYSIPVQPIALTLLFASADRLISTRRAQTARSAGSESRPSPYTGSGAMLPNTSGPLSRQPGKPLLPAFLTKDPALRAPKPDYQHQRSAPTKAATSSGAIRLAPQGLNEEQI